MTDYYKKYKKYKQKYLNLENISQYGGASNMNFTKGLEIYSNIVKLSHKFERVYENFWMNIYNNDAYVFYKNAIEYYKNVQNNNFHNFFSGIINKKLYTGSCQYIENNKRQDFINDKNIKKVDIDDLCNLSVQVINILDTVFLNCPNIPENIFVYRSEFRKKNEEIFNLKKGDYYQCFGYMSSSINPWIYYSRDGLYLMNDNEKIVIMTILLPKDSFGYYMNNPFVLKKDEILKKFIGFQEYEILLPRNNIFEVIETKNTNKIFFIKLLLKYQMNPKEHIISIENKNIPSSILSKKSIDKTKYFEINGNKKSFPENNIKIDLYNEYLISNKESKYTKFVYENIYDINIKDLQEWMKIKPKYNEKYNIAKDKFEEVYNKFIDITKNMKKIKNVYISGKYKFFNNYNYKDLLNIYKGKTIKFTKPLIFSKKLDSSIISESGMFICNDKNEKDTTCKIDTSYPYLIIIKYKTLFSYIPTSKQEGFTFDITEMKINKIEKINLFDDIFYYYIEAN